MPNAMNRRRFVGLLAGGAAASMLPRGAFAAQRRGRRPNVLLITVDDMDYGSLGATGSKVPNITPNIDRLASEGVLFEHAHVTAAVCQPCRQVLMTGRYPHRNGARGFEPIRTDVPTLQEHLRPAGYVNGILGKVPHLAPQRKFCWDTVVRARELGTGRDPELYYKHAKEFFEKAKQAGKPFFLMANSHDPHRPFARRRQGRGRPKRRRGGAAFAKASRHYEPKEVEVPGFLPDIPLVRKEVAQYFTSVHRCDETSGAVLRALKDAGLDENTLVMFLSDNGMAFPFAKTNVWRASTRTPWICRWPGKIKPGTVDREHFISGIDFMPTILDVAGLRQIADMDGRSFLPVLTGGRQEGRDRVFTVFHKTAARREYPMRSIQNKRFGYIFNAWSNGKAVFRNESQSGLTFNAMRAAAKTDKRIAARVKHFLYRVREELYDYEADPNALRNLIDDPKHKDVANRIRRALVKAMSAHKDPLLPELRKQIGTAT